MNLQVKRQQGYQDCGDNEANHKSAATNQNRRVKQDGVRGRRQGRDAVRACGRCAAREDRDQKRALWGRSHRSSTRYRCNRCRCRQEPGFKDDMADPLRE
jgi:hypothetical protein